MHQEPAERATCKEHYCEGREDASNASGIEIQKAKRAAFEVRYQDRRDEVSRDYKEYVYADETTGKDRREGMEQDDCGDGYGS
jgi:hypothetical protein